MKLLALLSIAVVLVAVSPDVSTGKQAPQVAADSAAPPPDPRVVRGRETIARFRDQLLAALDAALKSSGPAAAIDVCATTAPALAKALSTPSVTVGRAGTRLRNPANAPPAWVAPVQAELAQQKPEERGPRVVNVSDGVVGVVVPIPLGKPCLQCHGTDIATDVTAALAKRYPKDAATGYREGELRGVFWAEVR